MSSLFIVKLKVADISNVNRALDAGKPVSVKRCFGKVLLVFFVSFFVILGKFVSCDSFWKKIPITMKFMAILMVIRGVILEDKEKS